MKWGRVAAGLAAMLAVVAVVVALLTAAGGVDNVRQVVADAGFWAPLLFLVLQSAITIAPIPRTAFMVAGGVLFGSITGVVLVLIGTVVAATLAFWLVRLVGGEFVERHAHHPALAWIRARVEHSGLLTMLSLRMIPAVPFSVMNYASGLSGVRFRHFALGTLLGVFPGSVSVVFLADAVAGGNFPPQLLAVSITCGLIGLAGAVVAIRRNPVPVEREQAPEPVS